MRMWLDDIRPMPEGYDVWVKTAEDAELLISKGIISFINFDHDLGEGGTGYDVANYIESYIVTIKPAKMIDWVVHSSNPEGRRRIDLAMTSAQRLLEQSGI